MAEGGFQQNAEGGLDREEGGQTTWDGILNETILEEVLESLLIRRENGSQGQTVRRVESERDRQLEAAWDNGINYGNIEEPQNLQNDEEVNLFLQGWRENENQRGGAIYTEEEIRAWEQRREEQFHPPQDEGFEEELPTECDI